MARIQALALAAAFALASAAPSGAASRASAVPRVPALVAPTAPQTARLAEILSAAQASPTAAAILERAARLRQDSPIPVSFKPLKSDHGYFDYETGGVAMADRYRRGDPRRAAPTLVHEILHVAQDDARTPGQALERELEAHALTLRILDELGVVDESPFTVKARKLLAYSPVDFRDWMRLNHHLSIEHRPRMRAELAAEAEYDLEQAEDRYARRRANLERAPSSRRLRALVAESEGELAAIHRQLDALSPAGWRRYKRWAGKVDALLREEHDRLNGR